MEKQAPKVNETDVQRAITAHEIYSKAVDKIQVRTDYIIRHCAEIACVKLDWWDWNCDGEYEDRTSGDFMRSYDKDYIGVRAVWDKYQEIVFIDKNGNDWDFTQGFPTRWLYEDFEEEFAKGLKAFKEKEKKRKEEEKEKRKRKEEEKKKAVIVIASKLTKEERKLLGIK